MAASLPGRGRRLVNRPRLDEHRDERHTVAEYQMRHRHLAPGIICTARAVS